METVAATKLLSGMGVNYDLRSDVNIDQAFKELSDAGITTVRHQVKWGSMNDTNTDLNATAKQSLTDLAATAKKYKITPLITLSADSDNPQPMVKSTAILAVKAAVGATKLTFRGNLTTSLTAKYSGMDDNLPAATLFKTMELKSGNTEVTLSKPLAKALNNGKRINISTFKYLPLYATSQPEFTATADAWVNYAKAVAKVLADTGIDKFEIEIWDQTKTGSEFLDINNYYKPALSTETTDRFAKDGKAWKLADLTTKALKAAHGSKINIVWGFSNSDPYRTASDTLPANTDVEGYQPFGTDYQTYAQIIGNNKDKLLGPDAKTSKIIPDGRVSNPEGRDAFQMTWPNSLITKKLAPWKRNAAKPTGTDKLLHYFTEHGIQENVRTTDSDTGAQIPDEHWRAASLLRMYMFWLNKGVDKVFYDDKTPDLLENKGNGGASKSLRAISRMASKFAGATSISSPRQLEADVTATGKQSTVFRGDGTVVNALWNRDLFTLLPYQVADKKFVIADYVLTHNNTSESNEMAFTVKLKNLDGPNTIATYYDPVDGRSEPIKVAARDATSVTLELQATDYPRLITLEESGADQMVGYAGCSNATDSVQGYITAGGKHFWKPGSKDSTYSNGTIRQWASGIQTDGKVSGELWDDFNQMLKANNNDTKTTKKVWLSLCTKPSTKDTDAQNYDAAVAVVDKIKKLVTGATVYASAVNGYITPHICSSFGADGPTRMQTLADKLVTNGKATAGPKPTALYSTAKPPSAGAGTNETDTDGCRANTAGEAKLGADLVTAFGK